MSWLEGQPPESRLPFRKTSEGLKPLIKEFWKRLLDIRLERFFLFVCFASQNTPRQVHWLRPVCRSESFLGIPECFLCWEWGLGGIRVRALLIRLALAQLINQTEFYLAPHFWSRTLVYYRWNKQCSEMNVSQSRWFRFQNSSSFHSAICLSHTLVLRRWRDMERDLGRSFSE